MPLCPQVWLVQQKNLQLISWISFTFSLRQAQPAEASTIKPLSDCNPHRLPPGLKQPEMKQDRAASQGSVTEMRSKECLWAEGGLFEITFSFENLDLKRDYKRKHNIDFLNKSFIRSGTEEMWSNARNVLYAGLWMMTPRCFQQAMYATQQTKAIRCHTLRHNKPVSTKAIALKKKKTHTNTQRKKKGLMETNSSVLSAVQNVPQGSFDRANMLSVSLTVTPSFTRTRSIFCISFLKLSLKRNHLWSVITKTA